MKKLITSLLVIVLLFNFICPTCIVLATGESGGDPDVEEPEDAYAQDAQESETAVSDMAYKGEVSQTQGNATKTTLTLGGAGASLLGAITGLLARFLNIFIVQIDVIMGAISSSEEGGKTSFWYSIDRTVFNRVALFNINYFNTDATYEVGNNLEVTANASNIKVKEGIIYVYYICRMLAISLLLLVLIYIGIRMALSTVASEQAKFKKMLTSWIESLVLVFAMVYIMSAVIYIGEILTGIFYDIRCQMLADPVFGGKGLFEDTVRSETIIGIFTKSGLDLTMWSIVYWCLLFLEIKFFWLYAKRLLMVGFLITISPLITVTYSIDKAGDGRAQVLSSWMKEFVVNVLIQPLHALIYLVFVFTANSIALESPLVALALLMCMGTVERMVKVVFDLRGLTSLRGVNKFMKKQ